MRHNNNRMRKLTIEVDADKASPVIFSLFESSVIPIQQIMEGTTQPLLFGIESWSGGIVQMLKPINELIFIMSAMPLELETKVIRRFLNPEDFTIMGLLLIESTYKRFHI